MRDTLRLSGAVSMLYSRRDPVIHPVPILDLRPTQMTVGFREVERKRKAWGGKADKDGALASHMVPVVLGPGGERYITDHHHLARALLDAGEKEVFVCIVGDLHKADPENFWTLMDFHGWTHPFDEKGRRGGYTDLPKAVQGLKDDPYRSLSGSLRRHGGFAKDATPFSEFVWADFFRSRIKPQDLQSDFDAALAKAMTLAKSTDADYLPGWCGPQDDKPAGGKSGGKKAG
jgi:hypothetical protein